ncbi:MAG TPA: formate dehydrogenase accessory protein FdhE [Candidatus Methylomirabilis sp.]|nr:formate dehydrogenase accessory protein FdhE [Candidatus Methylomirabilis sp.]
MEELTGDNATPGRDEIKARLEALIAEPHVSEEYVRFRMDLLQAQWAVRQALVGTSPPGHPRGTTGTMAAGQDEPEPTPGEPALDPSAVSFDPALLRALFSALCASAARGGRQTEDMKRLTAAVEANPELLERLVRQAAFGPAMRELEALARELRVFIDALLFVGRALAAPFVAEAARRIGAGSGGAAARGRCPVCGSPPSLATLRRQDGRRILTCSLCGTRWEFTRLACPWCEQADPEALGLLRVSEGDPRWIETCERCRGYLKSVDERRLPLGEAIIPVVEEAATLHLDLLAEKEGYIRRLPYVLSG